MNESTCRSCGARIIWVLTVTGKRMPVDARPVQNGNLVLELQKSGELLARYVAPGLEGSHVSQYAVARAEAATARAEKAEADLQRESNRADHHFQRAETAEADRDRLNRELCDSKKHRTDMIAECTRLRPVVEALKSWVSRADEHGVACECDDCDHSRATVFSLTRTLDGKGGRTCGECYWRAPDNNYCGNPKANACGLPRMKDSSCAAFVPREVKP